MNEENVLFLSGYISISSPFSLTLNLGNSYRRRQSKISILSYMFPSDQFFLCFTTLFFIHDKIALNENIKHLYTVVLLQVYDVKQAVYEFVMVGAKGLGGSSPLHLACSRIYCVVFYGTTLPLNFPSVPTIDLLLECGAPADARDNDGNTPLHAAACNKPVKAGVIQSLLQHGAHCDLVNNEKRTFSDLLEGTPLHEITNLAIQPSLACLSARVVRKHGLEVDSLPVILRAFVLTH